MPVFLLGLLRTALQIAVPLAVQEYFERRKAAREEAKKKAEEQAKDKPGQSI